MVDLVFLKVLFSSYRHTYFGVAMLIISLTIATTGLSSVLIINQSAKQSYDSTDQFLISNVSHRIVPITKDRPITKNDFAQLRNQGLSNLVPIAQQRTYLFKNEQKIIPSRVQFTGIDTVSLFPILFHLQSQTDDPRSGLERFGILGGAAIAHPTLVELLDNSFNGIQLNDEPTQKLKELEIIAFDEPSLGNDIIVDIQDFFELFPNSDITQLFLIDDGTLNLSIEEIKSILPSHVSLEIVNNTNNNQELTSSFHLNLTAMALLMFVVCMFIVLNSANLLINNRMGWFKVCRQLGIPRLSIFKFQLLEILTLGMLSTLIGVFISIDLVNLVSPTVQATLEGLSGQEIGYGTTSLIGLFIQVYLITAIGCMIATFAPIINSNSRLASAGHSQSAISLQKQTVIFSICAFGLSVVFILLISLANNLLSLLIASALLILSGCCAMLACYPMILKYLSKIIPTSTPLLKIASKQGVFLSGKTKIASCAFFIAVTSNIGMNLMVDSFRNATQAWLDTRLASDYYLYYAGTVDLKSIEQTSNLTITPRKDKQIEYRQTPVQLYSYPTSEAFKNAMVFAEVEEVAKTWEAFQNQDGILVNQQFAYSLNFELNDSVQIPHPVTNQIQEFRIVGIYYDYGNPFKQALLPLSLFSQSDAKSTVYAIELNGGNIDSLVTFLEQSDASSDEYQIYKTEELLNLSMQTFDKTFLITDGLNIVTLLVASFSLACVMIILMQDDRSHNMLIRSFGVAKIKVQLLSLYQYILLCIVGLFFATPFGVLLSWVLIFKINLQAFSWTYPLIVDVNNIITIYGLSILIVLCVVSIPFFKATNRPIIEDLRCLN